MQPADAPKLLRVLGRPEAERLVAELLAVMGELELVLEAETAQLRIGRVRDGLAQEARKSELAGAYLRGLEGVKANAIALARFAPDALDRLRGAHARFGRALEANQVVLATARAVSEGLIKELAGEMNRARRPAGYAPAGYAAQGAAQARAAGAEPLVLSRRL